MRLPALLGLGLFVLTLNNSMIADTATTETPLALPDPSIIVTGCTNVGLPCTLTASSLSNASMSGWTYQWKLNTLPVATTATYSPVLSAPGTYTFELVATNAFGSTTAMKSLNVAAPICTGAPHDVAVIANPSCASSGTCTTSTAIQLSPYAWGYTLQTCDTFSWTFGDGTSSSLKSPTHTYSSDGTYTVTLKITNSNGNASGTSTIVIGTVPPPPPSCPTIAPSNIYFTLTAASGCSASNPHCAVAETITFAPAPWGYTLQTCDAFVWNFGDGTYSTVRNPSHAYAQEGTYPVTLQVSNDLGGATSPAINVVIGNPPPPTPPTACGDQTGDGVLGPSDIFFLINYLFAAGQAPTTCPHEIDPSNVQQAGGVYAPFNLSAIDPDLVSGNIRSATTIFGIAGNSNVVNTSTGDAIAADIASGKKAWIRGVQVTGTAALALPNFAPVPRTGITNCYSAGVLVACSGSGQDGATLAGVPLPNPRFTINGDGTVTDRLTGLVWLRDAGCMGGRTWTEALGSVKNLASGTCGLTDASLPGEWRVPNVKELQSLINYQYVNPSLSNTSGSMNHSDGDPFFGVRPASFWSSTPTINIGGAHIISLADGGTADGAANEVFYVWPVRNSR